MAQHKDESGRPTTNRGKAPHRGGYSARAKGVNPFKTWLERTVWELGGAPNNQIAVKVSRFNSGKRWKYKPAN